LIKNYKQAISFINKITLSDREKYSGNIGLTRQKYILHLLGDPQDKVKTIHIAGTSGKGSTSFYLSSLLISHGFKVGLTLSPHLLDIRERMLINNKVISKKKFVHYLNQIIPSINLAKENKYGKPGYFEFLLLLSFHVFAKEKVDYIVLETGIGGLLDSSNVISRLDKVCLLTKFGLDHTAVLGKNIKSIAFQKAGIIHSKNPVFSINQITVAQKVLNKTAKNNHTSINYICPKINFKNIHSQNNFLIYDFSYQNLNIPKLVLNTIGLYQAENSALSLSAFSFLASRDNFYLNISKIKNVFLTTKFYGRADLYQINSRNTILDGAHNPQKIRAIVKSLKIFFPNQKFTIILAYKKRSDFLKMVSLITPIANTFIITSLIRKTGDFNDYINSQKILNTIFKKNKNIKFHVIPNNINAFNAALKLTSPILITGSLYLVGNLYPLVTNFKKNNSN
jgi:dihydrofolate synthase / folylpolyglutamate synthase